MLAGTQGSLASESTKAGKFADGCAFGLESIFRSLQVGVAESHAADQDLPVRNVQMAANDPVVLGKRCPRAGVEADAARHYHDILHEHAKIEPASDLQPVVECEEQADWCTEEAVVEGVLARHRRTVTFGDPK